MLRKLADAQTLEVDYAEQNGRLPDMWKAGHRVTFDYKPRPGYIYVRSRLISSRCNDNFDEFPGQEIIGTSHTAGIAPEDLTGYLTFLGKPVFVNHHNANHRRARGIITQAALHEDLNPDRSPDIWAEGLQEVDAQTFPRLAKALLNKWIERTSMGVDVAHSYCSACGNKATTPLEYCAHIPGQKGRKFHGFDHTGSRKTTLIRETCHGLRFFENSLLVEDPADPTAYVLGSIEVGPGLEHLSATASRAGESSVDRGRTSARPARSGSRPGATGMVPGSGVTRTASFHSPTVSGGIFPGSVNGTARKENDDAQAFARHARHLITGRRCVGCFGPNTVADRAGNTECVDCGHSFHASAIRPEAAGPLYPDPADHPWFQANPVHHDNIVDHWNKATPGEKEQGKRWYADAHIVSTALGEHHEKLYGPSPHGAAHLGAGVVANYSPQTGWESNLHNAARVLHGNQALGGKGSGIFASENQKKQAQRLLGGERHEDVLKGPKIQDFAHLIEHGGDLDPTAPRAVIDRHALSVATGKRVSDEQFGKFPSAQRHYYGHAVAQYHEAARRISEKSDEPVHAHQVQAVTWLARQRLNQQDEREGRGSDQTPGNRGRDVGRERARAKQRQDWEDWQRQHAPNTRGPGTGYQASRRRGADPMGRGSGLAPADDQESARGRLGATSGHARFLEPPTGIRSLAYGETKAPPDVDTLRDENCPVCGDSNSWDGNTCPVCGFVQPPKQFQDPDLDVARQVDLRKNDGDLDSTDVSDLEQQTNDRDGDGFDDITGEPVDEEEKGLLDDQPTLVCPNCETEFPAGEPETVNTRDPEMGSDEGGGPEAGDVCPACGKAELMTADEMGQAAEMGDEIDPRSDPDRDPEQDPDVDQDAAQEETDHGAPPIGGAPEEGDKPGDSEGDSEEDDEDDSDEDGKNRPPAKTQGSPFKR